MKKKFTAAVLCVVLAGMLTACSGGQLSNDNLTIKQYKGLEIAQVDDPEEVTDAYIESTMNSYRGVSLLTEGTAENGDTVSLDYEGKVDGVAFDGGTATGAELELGSGTYIGANGDYKGFEEQVVGHDVGETFDIEVKFPADYQSTEMADKVAVFTVTIKGIYPEINDEWVKTVSDESETVEEFKEELRTNIETYNQEKVQSTLRTEVMDALLEQVEVKELPEEDVENEVTQLRAYYEQMAEQYEVDFAEFLSSYMGMDEESFTEQAQEAAETSVTRKIACELIAEKQKLTLSDEEMTTAMADLAEESGYDDVDSFIEAYGEDVIKDSILQRTVADYLVENCVQVESSDSDTAE